MQAQICWVNSKQTKQTQLTMPQQAEPETQKDMPFSCSCDAAEQVRCLSATPQIRADKSLEASCGPDSHCSTQRGTCRVGLLQLAICPHLTNPSWEYRHKLLGDCSSFATPITSHGSLVSRQCQSSINATTTNAVGSMGNVLQ